MTRLSPRIQFLYRRAADLNETSAHILQTLARRLTSFIGSELKILRTISYWLKAIASWERTTTAGSSDSILSKLEMVKMAP